MTLNMTGTGNLQINVGSEPRWGPAIPHIQKLYAFVTSEEMGWL